MKLLKYARQKWYPYSVASIRAAGGIWTGDDGDATLVVAILTRAEADILRTAADTAQPKPPPIWYDTPSWLRPLDVQ